MLIFPLLLKVDELVWTINTSLVVAVLVPNDANVIVLPSPLREAKAAPPPPVPKVGPPPETVTVLCCPTLVVKPAKVENARLLTFLREPDVKWIWYR
jgi:hypothetical protein